MTNLKANSARLFESKSIKISRPLMGHIDSHIDVPTVNYQELRGGDGKSESSPAIRERVLRTRDSFQPLRG